MSTSSVQPLSLSVPRAAALYIGALLGPGLLLLPGLAAAQAGPASILAWAGLLVLSAILAMVFSRLGRVVPGAAGAAGYAAAGPGPRAGPGAPGGVPGGGHRRRADRVPHRRWLRHRPDRRRHTGPRRRRGRPAAGRARCGRGRGP